MKRVKSWLIFGLFFIFSLSFLCVTLQALLLEKSYLVEQKGRILIICWQPGRN